MKNYEITYIEYNILLVRVVQANDIYEAISGVGILWGQIIKVELVPVQS